MTTQLLNKQSTELSTEVKSLSQEEFLKTLKERRERLVQSLFSNEYKYSSCEYLCKSNKYNVWGIACDIYHNEIGRLKIKEKKDIISFDGFIRSLPPKVATAFGITENTELYINYLINEEGLSDEDIGVELLEKFEILGSPVSTYSHYRYPYYGD